MSTFQTFQPALSLDWGWINVILAAFPIYVVSHLLYNGFFHPLSKFPGPRLWAMTNIPYAIHLLSGNLPFKISEIHEKYGSVVRLTPNQLSYIDEDAWNDIYGKLPGGGQMLKESRRPPGPKKKLNSLFSAQNEADHARMRRNFSHAFSEKAIREQEPIMTNYFDLLIKRLHQNYKNPIDIVEWYNFTTFDIIGDLMFAESYGCLEKSRMHVWISFLFDQLWAIGLLQVIRGYPPLETIFLWLIPDTTKEKGVQHQDLISARIDNRLALESSRFDMMTNVQKNLDTPEGMTVEEIRATMVNFVVAGSETSATLLSGATYLLSKNPHAYQRLVDEIRTTFQTESQIVISSIQGLKFQRAVLDEALRIFPPAPANLSRVTPPGGRMIAGRFVPGNTVVGVSQWGSNHSPSNFREPNEFIPERWLGDAKYSGDRKKAAQPFSVGPRNCIGQNLAYNEMGVILARVLWNFDIELCDESQGWMEKLKVYTLWKKQPMMVKLTPVIRP